jgi:hypothetical protein
MRRHLCFNFNPCRRTPSLWRPPPEPVLASNTISVFRKFVYYLRGFEKSNSMLRRVAGGVRLGLVQQRGARIERAESIRIAKGRDRSGNADGPLHDLADYHLVGMYCAVRTAIVFLLCGSLPLHFVFSPYFSTRTLYYFFLIGGMIRWIGGSGDAQTKIVATRSRTRSTSRSKIE